MASIYETLTWHEIQVASNAASRYIPLVYGEVGTEGTRITLIAGTHGDEGPWSALAIKKLLRHPVENLNGRIRVIPTANALAAEADARNSTIDSPNSFDLDSCFPGTREGSYTQRLAAHLTPLLEDSDVIIDLHGGGSWCVNAFVKRFEGSEELAANIGAPFITNAPNKPGGLTTVALSQGKKVVNIEMGGRSGAEMYWCDQIVTGMERALYYLEVLSLDTPPAPPEPAMDVSSTEAIRAQSGGIFVPTVTEEVVGKILPEGTEMGKILDLHTLEEIQVFTAPHPQTAMMLLRPQICVVESTALIYVIARPLAE
jgi:predicted deacylase